MVGSRTFEHIRKWPWTGCLNTEAPFHDTHVSPVSVPTIGNFPVHLFASWTLVRGCHSNSMALALVSGEPRSLISLCPWGMVAEDSWYLGLAILVGGLVNLGGLPRTGGLLQTWRMPARPQAGSLGSLARDGSRESSDYSRNITALWVIS